jgi:hypothetical protein
MPVRFGGRGKAFFVPTPIATPREPSRRVRYDRAQLIPEGLPRRKRVPQDNTDRSGTKCPMMFELLFDVVTVS